MSLTTVTLLLAVGSLILWMRRIVTLVFGVSRAVGKRPSKDVAPSFEERLEAQLASLHAAKSDPIAMERVIEGSDPARAVPAPSGFGRKRA